MRGDPEGGQKYCASLVTGRLTYDSAVLSEISHVYVVPIYHA
jgi:hypothetical protein